MRYIGSGVCTHLSSVQLNTPRCRPRPPAESETPRSVPVTQRSVQWMCVPSSNVSSPGLSEESMAVVISFNVSDSASLSSLDCFVSNGASTGTTSKAFEPPHLRALQEGRYCSSEDMAASGRQQLAGGTSSGGGSGDICDGWDDNRKRDRPLLEK